MAEFVPDPAREALLREWAAEWRQSTSFHDADLAYLLAALDAARSLCRATEDDLRACEDDLADSEAELEALRAGRPWEGHTP